MNNSLVFSKFLSLHLDSFDQQSAHQHSNYLTPVLFRRFTKADLVEGKQVFSLRVEKIVVIIHLFTKLLARILTVLKKKQGEIGHADKNYDQVVVVVVGELQLC